MIVSVSFMITKTGVTLIFLVLSIKHFINIQTLDFPIHDVYCIGTTKWNFYGPNNKMTFVQPYGNNTHITKKQNGNLFSTYV